MQSVDTAGPGIAQAQEGIGQGGSGGKHEQLAALAFVKSGKLTVQRGSARQRSTDAENPGAFSGKFAKSWLGRALRGNHTDENENEDQQHWQWQRRHPLQEIASRAAEDSICTTLEKLAGLVQQQHLSSCPAQAPAKVGKALLPEPCKEGAVLPARPPPLSPPKM